MLRFLPRDGSEPTPAALMALKPYGGVMARLLVARGLSSAQEAERFLCPSPAQFHDPFAMEGMDRAVEILQNAKQQQLPTVVYGDYDVDGMCANALLCDALARFGLEAAPHVPLREEGYGLNQEAVRKLAESYRLLITVDLGITNWEEVALARELGMTVIVTDHHQLGLVPCLADVVLSPLLGEYPCPKLCGTGVALKLAQALLGMEDAGQYLDLAALATVADIVPLVEENRAIVALGLPLIAAREREGIRALLEVSGTTKPVDTDTLGFQLGPRLNAAGRLGNAAQGVRLMLTRDPAEADTIAGELDRLNTQRRSMENEVVEAALAQAEAHDFVEERALLVQGENWHVGVIGLAAGRLCTRYACPTAVFSLQEGMLHGSLRSIPGVNIHKCLQTCDDLLTRYGGHEQAAGCTLPLEHYEEFCSRMQRAVRLAAPETAFIPAQEYDAVLPLAEAGDALALELDRLAPFGLGNPSPLFLAEGVRLERRRAVGAGGAHLQVTLRDGNRVMDGIAFGKGKEAMELPDKVDMVYRFIWNSFRGDTTLQCEGKAFRPAVGAQRAALEAAGPEAAAMALVDALLEMQEQKAGENTTKSENNRVMEGRTEDFSGWPRPRRGTLYVARTLESAVKALEAFEPSALQDASEMPPELAWRVASGALCFPTVLVLPLLQEMKGCWRQVCLLDGELFPGEAELLKSKLPRAQVWAAPHTDALRQLRSSLDAGDEGYRGLYKQLRGHAFAALSQAAIAAGLTLPQTRVGLLAFQQVGLLHYTESPFSYSLRPPTPCTLGESPLLKAIRHFTA